MSYRRLKKGFYRFYDGFADCEHLLNVEIRGNSDYSLTAEFGLHNEDATGFAIETLTRYGDSRFTNWSSRASGCLIWFSIGELLGWYPGAALWQHQSSDQEFAASFVFAVESQIVPIVKKIDSVSALLQLLLSNEPPYRWVKSNGAVRAAQIIFLARQQGQSSEALIASLQPFLVEIKIGLGRRCNLSPADFVESVIADADHRFLE